MNKEELRAIARNNYAAQMEMLGYDTDGNPKDMVEVVRCKDCKHFYSEVKSVFTTYIGCDANHNSWGGDWFCADGERKVSK